MWAHLHSSGGWGGGGGACRMALTVKLWITEIRQILCVWTKLLCVHFFRIENNHFLHLFGKQLRSMPGSISTSDHATNALMCFWKMALVKLSILYWLKCCFVFVFLVLAFLKFSWGGLLWHNAAAQHWHTNHQDWWWYNCSLLILFRSLFHGILSSVFLPN